MGTSYAAILRMSIPKIALLRTSRPQKCPLCFSACLRYCAAMEGLDDVAFSGERMRSARVNRGMSQEDVAVAIGMSVDSVGRYEAGKAPRGEKVAIRGGSDTPRIATEYLVVPGAGVERKLSSIAMQHITPSTCPSYVQKHARRVRFPLDLYAQARIISLAPRGTGAQNLGRRWEK